jgi:hypothetical protein
LAVCSPLETSLALAAVLVTAYVILAPIAASRYVPLIDLPFHVTSGATFAHYFNPSYHFKEQFTLHPLESPYMSMYALVAVLTLVFPVLIAAKIAVACMLLLVPVGLAVLFHGAKKSPLLGLLGLGLLWGNLTQWGFLSYMTALGLFAMVVGFTMMVVDRPTRLRQLGLALALLALFFTHMFRFPFAAAAVVGTAIVLYPATKRIAPVVLPLLPAALLFAVWWKIRPNSLGGKVELGFHPERLAAEFANVMIDGFKDDGPRRAMALGFDAAWVLAAVAANHAVVRRARRFRRFTAWDAGVTIAPLACAAVFFALFLIMPMWIGSWWYVYPREATAAVIILYGACPDLPRPWPLRAALVALIAIPPAIAASRVATRFATFDPITADFYQITRQIPQAPKLFYMIFDHSGTNRSTSPFLHLPAYVQAEKGGWLSWHFAIWNQSPIRYREGLGAVVVPRTPPNWEWTPRQFKLSMTPFFDWFLVRQATSPDALFAPDPSIVRVDHVGMWWLYQRRR